RGGRRCSRSCLNSTDDADASTCRDEEALSQRQGALDSQDVSTTENTDNTASRARSKRSCSPEEEDRLLRARLASCFSHTLVRRAGTNKRDSDRKRGVMSACGGVIASCRGI